ncbi:MAG: hypothetical protein HYW25_03035 [Candidatus Aenigmarchaeota archaeon]|nr:hypothetical protein [Candidatus Aenigmarchaeota archaeon]
MHLSLQRKVRSVTMAERPVPVEEVKAMVSHGFSERDIIKQLKAQGYSFGEIEKAILEVVKSGVTPEPAPQPQPETPEEFREEPEPAKGEPRRPSRMAYRPPDVLEPLPPLPEPSQEEPPEKEDGEDQQQYVEDIVESVLEEKFEKFISELKIMKDEFEQLRSEVAMLKQERHETAEVPSDLAAKMDDLEARVGGLEKAFRQYLPELAKGIERLSRVVRREA